MGQDIFNKEIRIEDCDGNTIMSFTITPDGILDNFINCEIADLEEDGIRVQQLEQYYEG
jgi:hypothetical protein